MIPTVFEHKARARQSLSAMEKVIWSRRCRGRSSVSPGGRRARRVGINLVLRTSYKANGRPPRRSGSSSGFYVVAAAITWMFCARREIILHAHDARTALPTAAVPA